MAEAKDSSGQGGGSSARNRNLNWRALVADLSEACARGRSFNLLPIYRSTIKLTAAHVDVLLTEHLGDPVGQKREGLAQALSEAAEYFLPAVALQSYPTTRKSEKKIRDIEKAALKLRKALNLRSDDNARLWLRQGATWDDGGMKGAVNVVAFIQRAARQAQAIIAKRHRPLSKHALRVAVHWLAQCWYYAYGEEPGAGYDPIKQEPDGPFINFARAFFNALIECTSAKQMKKYPQLERLLPPSDHTIRMYLQAWKRRNREGRSPDR